MKYFVIIVVLVISVALVNVDGSYTYQIYAKRTENVMGPGAPVAYMDSKVTPKQNLTYFQSVGPDNPLLLEGYVANGVTEYFDNDGEALLSACNSFAPNSWRYVVTEVINKAVLPGGDCSAKKGSYMIDQTVGPVTVTFSDKIKCGDYDLSISANVAPRTLVFQLTFTFNIPKNGNCS